MMKKDEGVKYGQVRHHLIKSEGLRNEEDEWLRAQKLGLSRQAADLMKKNDHLPRKDLSGQHRSHHLTPA